MICFVFVPGNTGSKTCNELVKMRKSNCVENWPNNDPIYPKTFTFCVFLILYLSPLVVISVAYTRVGIQLRACSHKADLFARAKHKNENISVRTRARQKIRVHSKDMISCNSLTIGGKALHSLQAKNVKRLCIHFNFM